MVTSVRGGRLAGAFAICLALLTVLSCSGAAPTPLPLVLAAPLVQGAAAPAGRIAFVVNGDLWEWQDGAVRQLTSGTRYEGPAWSPDGNQLAASMVGTNHSDVVLLSPDGDFQARLTDNLGRLRIQDSDWARLPAWSPDGTRIAFGADTRTYDLALWLVGTDGRGARQVFAAPDGMGGIDRPTWSPDGSEIAVTVWRQGSPSQVEVVSVATGRTRRLTDAATGAYDPAWSPDGNWIAYVVRDGTHHDVWLVHPDGTGAVRLTSSGRNRMPAWSPDGSWLAFLSLNETGFDVRVAAVPAADAQDVEPSEGRALVSARPVEGASGLTWGP
ncbi:MAG TPA: DPP IV N-terminal domain-containing protein [Chloroflexota bacterium]|nr:DPP IV N-terminal domain-containing protein [Chloroflexota bacterium]